MKGWCDGMRERFIPTEEERIRHIITRGMKEKKISRTQLAEELGMAKSTLSQRFSGVTEFKLAELIAICDLLGIKIEIGE
jgi:transcriptional regulator with XRE-family HTH domain